MNKRIRTDNWAKENPEKHRARVASWRARNPEKAKAISKTSHERNKEKRNAAACLYRAEHRERMRELTHAWEKKNVEKVNIAKAARRAAKHRATPLWAKDELDSFIVKEMYDLAARRTRSTGIPWHVDHIVPLKSKIVCGLHCAANLRVIPGAVNHSKGNRTWPDMP